MINAIFPIMPGSNGNSLFLDALAMKQAIYNSCHANMRIKYDGQPGVDITNPAITVDNVVSVFVPFKR